MNDVQFIQIFFNNFQRHNTQKQKIKIILMLKCDQLWPFGLIQIFIQNDYKVKMFDNMVRLYKQRLQSFSQTIAYLHEIVGADQALALLKDQKLVQYKIDRIAELVHQVLSSEKERIIMHLILKIQSLQQRLLTKQPKNTQIQSSENNYYRQRLEQKNQEIQKLKSQRNCLKEKCEEQKKIATQLKAQFEIYQSKYKDIKQKWERMEEIKQYDQREQTQKLEVSNSKIKLLEEQLQKQKKIMRDGEQAKLKMEATLSTLKEENELLASKISDMKQPSSKQKLEKTENLKKEVRKLGNELNQMKQMTRIILDYISKSLYGQLQGIRKESNSLGSYITNQLKNFMKYFAKSFEETGKMVSTGKVTAQQDDQLIKRMQILQGELDNFIQINKL